MLLGRAAPHRTAPHRTYRTAPHRTAPHRTAPRRIAGGFDVNTLKIPVIGGHSGLSILPVLSQCEPPIKDLLSAEEIAAITTRIQNAGTEVVDAKAGAGSATLSMAKVGGHPSGLRGVGGVAREQLGCSKRAARV